MGIGIIFVFIVLYGYEVEDDSVFSILIYSDYCSGLMPGLAETYDNYIWSLWISRYLLSSLIFAALLLGSSSLAGEELYKTVLFLTGKPLSRREIYTTKTAAGLFLLSVIAGLSSLIILIISLLKGYSLNISAVLLGVLIALTGSFTVYLGALLFSALTSHPLKALTAAALFWFLLFLPGFFAPSAWYSLLNYMKGVSFWVEKDNPLVPLGLFLVICGGLYELGVWIWGNREY